MKKTKGILALALGLCITAVPGCVLAAETSEVNIEDLFYTYSKDNIVTDYESDDYLYATRQLEDKVYSGFLALKQLDLNWDGQDELLAIRIRPMEEDDTANRLVAEVYDYEGNKLQRIAQTDLAENVLAYNEANVDVFLVDTENGLYLACEDGETASILADGKDWSLKIFTLNGSEFQTITDTGIVGSDWDPQEESEAWEALNNLGIYPSDLVYTSIVDQCEQLNVINRISRYMIKDHLEIYDFLNNPDGDSILYGQTQFFSCVNDGLDNKIQGNFETLRYVETVQDIMSPENFVIPDSDSRFISSEDLDTLSEFEILIARNEIYARHGRMFNNEELRNYFESKAWYQPTVSGDAFTESYAASVFNEYELRNIDTIVKYEREHGLNQF